MKNKYKKYWLIPWRLIAIGLVAIMLIMVGSASAALMENNIKEEVVKIAEGGLFDEGYFVVESQKSKVEWGNKTTNDEDVVRFEAYPDKDTSGGVWGFLPKWLKESRKGVEFKLIKAIDAGDLENEVDNFNNSEEVDKTDVVSKLWNGLKKLGENLSGQIDSLTDIYEGAGELEEKVDNKIEKIVNPEVISDVDLEYQGLVNGLKEEIIVKASSGDVFDTYLFELNLDEDVILHRSQAGNRHGLPIGTYYFADTDHNYIGHFLPLVAYDSNGVTTNDVAMDIMSVETQNLESLHYVIVITVDKTWLSNPDLQYPIIIDPTIVHDTQGEFEAGQENRLETTTEPRTELKYHELPTDVNTVGLWHFDESTGQTVSDESGNGNDGTLGPTSGAETQDPAWNTTGQKLGDSAITFDGSSDYINIPDNESLRLSDELTLEAWTKGFENTSFDSYLITNPNNSLDPQMQVAGSKNFFVWLQNNQIWTASMNTDGTGWSATQRTSSAGNNQKPQLQVSGSKIYYIWLQSDGTYMQIWTASMNTDGTGWSAVKRTTSTSNKFYPQLHVVGSKIYYIWRQWDNVSAGQIWTATMNTDGSGWSATQRTSSSYDKTYPQFQVVENRVYCIWVELDGTYYQIWRAAMNTDGTGWSASKITTTTYQKDYPQFHVVGSIIYFVWQEHDGTRYQVWTGSMNTDGTGWSATKRTTSTYRKDNPQLQVVGSKIYYIWKEPDAIDYQIWTASMNTDGTGWSTIKNTTSAYTKSVPQFQVVGSKIYYTWQEWGGSMYSIWWATEGSNLINKGDHFGIGIDGSTVKPFVDAGVDSMKYNALAIDYSNGAMTEGVMDSNSWNHVAMTYDGGSLNCYLNGNLISSSPFDSSINTSDFPIIIGDHFDGDIDEVKVTSRALSPEEIFYDAQLRPYGEYTSDVIDLGVSNPTFNSLSWEEYGVRTGDGETDLTTAGLVAKWNFNETSGTSAGDASGNGHAGTLTNFASTGSQDAAAGTGWTSNNKKWGAGALMFDGTDDFVDAGNGASLQIVNDLTVETWVKINNIPNDNWQGIVSKAQFLGGGNYLGYELIVHPPDSGSCPGNYGKFAFQLLNNTSYVLCSNSRIETGKWYNLVGTYNATTNVANLYINGSLASTRTQDNAIGNSATNLLFGKRSWASGAGHQMYGIIDSTSIYSRALSADEILSNYQAGQIEFQTRTGTDDTPEDGGWEEWIPASGAIETSIQNFDSTLNTIDPDPFTTLLLHGEGNNGSQTFFDSSINPAPFIDFTGDAQNSTTQKKFGAGSLYFDGFGDELVVHSNPSAVQFGDSDFTIDFWTRYPNWLTGYYRSLFVEWEDSNHNIFLSQQEDNKLIFTFFSNNTPTAVTSTAAWAPNNNQWYHVALTRSGSSWRFFIDGTQLGSTITSSSIVDNCNGYVALGNRNFNDAHYETYLDEIRFSKGIARWTANFTPSKYAYNTGVNQISNKIDTNIKVEGTGSERCLIGQAQSDDNTVGLWHLDETGGAGAYIKDSSGNSYNGTPTGTSVADGVSGKARKFNGSSDYIDTPALSSFTSGNPTTFESWFKPEVLDGTQNIIMDSNFRIRMEISSTNQINVNLGNGSSWCVTNLTGGQALSAKQWYHATATWDNSALVLYLNGNKVASQSGTCSVNLSTMRIGQYTGGGSYYFPGDIDEVRISNVARTPEEIAEAYRMGAFHYLTRSLASPEDISSNNKLTYYIASDQPGTHINTTVGESPYANGQPDANTVGLWHMDGDNNEVLNYDLSGSTIRTRDWVEIDPNANKISQNNGVVLSAGTLAAWDSGLISRGTFEREAGKQIYAKFTTSTSVATPNHMMIGWGQNQISSGSYTTISHALYFNAGTFSVYQDGASFGGPYGSGYTANTTYEVRITLLPTGSAKYEIKGGTYTNWTTLLAADNPKTNESLRAQIAQYRHTGTFNTISVFNNDVVTDSSGYANDGRVFEAVSTQGKVGGARYFDGSNDYITFLDSDALSSATMTLEAWVNVGDMSGSSLIAGKGAEYWLAYNNTSTCSAANKFSFFLYDGDYQCVNSHFDVEKNRWYHVVGVSNGSALYLYVDGQLAGGPVTQGALIASANSFDIGSYAGTPYDALYNFNGSIDEVRLSNVARTPEEIRQAYEVGKRTHDVTIDFGASLDSGNLISGSGDTSFTVDATAYGLSQKGSNLFIGDKIIVRENYDGTEYMAQGTVDSVNQSTGAVTVVSWDAGGTFPSGGYTANADVFKWQKETFDIFGAMPSHVDAVDELSFRFLDGNQGRTFWIDDIGIEQNDGYLTDHTGSTITSSPNQYFQYKAILTTTDPDPTPAFGPITLDYDALDMTGAATLESYINTNNNTAFNIQCLGVSDGSTGNNVDCEGSFNQANWYTVGSDTTPLSGATIQGTPDISGWTGYPLGNGSVTIYARARNTDSDDYSGVHNFSVEKDMSRPSVTSITS
ncbi:hypothetical protein KJ855_01060, partial [Patescibacteria group bacterium]|nr:hypothetical protein [Patescibacteria group bacterium]